MTGHKGHTAARCRIIHKRLFAGHEVKLQKAGLTQNDPNPSVHFVKLPAPEL